MKVVVFSGPAPQRLDRFLAEAAPGLGTGQMHRFLRQNKIKLNGKKPALSARLVPGDEVRLYLPDDAFVPPLPPVLYEDEHLLVLQKPAGLVSLREEADERDSLLQRARHYLAQNTPVAGTFAPALCHRLDTGTSGVILVAKTEEMLQFVTHLIRHRQLEKMYYGLCAGTPPQREGRLENHLWKNAKTATVRIVPQDTRGAVAAVTSYQLLAQSGNVSLLQLWPHTGRTHQLRVQLAGVGLPLVGDSKYGDQALNRKMRCRYQCLCAAEVRFPTIEDGPFAAYSGLTIGCEKPWFYQKAFAKEFA